MRSALWSRCLPTAVVLLVFSGCGQEVTAPQNTRSILTTPSDPSRQETWTDGSTVTATTDDGTTISVNRSNHTATFNGETIIVTQEAADSLTNQLLRMYNVEKEVDATIAPPPPANPCTNPLELQCLWSIDPGYGELSIASTGPGYSMGPSTPEVGLIGGASYPVGFDPSFTCEDVSNNIYTENLSYVNSRKALVRGLSLAGGYAANIARGAPQSFAAPESWFGWAFLRAITPSMDVLYANCETSRIRLNTYAIWFRAMGCYTPPSPVSSPPSPGSGGPPLKTCYYRVTFYMDTGEIVSVQLLGCW